MIYQNIFVLSPGRSGSKSFVEASSHITNYSSAHESRAALLGAERFNFPSSHIEADNRLCWFFGELSSKFSGEDTLYIHLIRDLQETADSFLHRLRNSNYRASIMSAFSHGILMKPGDWSKDEEALVARFYVDTIHANIATFLKDKKHLVVHLQDGGESFDAFLSEIEAQGDLAAARQTWQMVHNAR